jgi:hypothetical protein
MPLRFVGNHAFFPMPADAGIPLCPIGQEMGKRNRPLHGLRLQQKKAAPQSRLSINGPAYEPDVPACTLASAFAFALASPDTPACFAPAFSCFAVFSDLGAMS